MNHDEHDIDPRLGAVDAGAARQGGSSGDTPGRHAAADDTPEAPPAPDGVRAPARPPSSGPGLDGVDPAAARQGGSSGDTSARAHDGADDEDDEEAEPAPAADDTAEASAEPDWKDKYVRAVAETDNVRKRARRDVGAAEARGVGKLAKELLPALDNLDRALAAVEAQDGDTEHELTRGIRLVQQELIAGLARVGVVTESPKGEPFDPHRHEALSQIPVAGTPAGVVVEVYQPGYAYAETVLRPAKVVVSA